MAREERQPLLHGHHGGNSNNRTHYEVTPEQLAQIVDNKNFDLLKKMGGVDSICKKVQVNPSTGLSTDEDVSNSSEKPFSDRQAHFGKNILPEAESKTFLQLLWAAYNDKTLIMLR
jgi:Ca2+-transporting ATPase